jgi:hypothetical protein
MYMYMHTCMYTMKTREDVALTLLTLTGVVECMYMYTRVCMFSTV